MFSLNIENRQNPPPVQWISCFSPRGEG